MERLTTKLPNILRVFDMGDALAFKEEEHYYIIIKRRSHLPIYNWRYFELVIKNVCEIKNMTLISALEIEDNPFKAYFIEKGTLIKRAI
ncbi:MAG TPA: hypothetical protein PLY27_05675 [Bacilli bacterium]|nr:hypothetical protein [Bacilli bacterium]